MNRSCCRPRWPQEGVYLSTNADLDRPDGWTTPAKILSHDDWYPWVMGTGEGETSAEAGQRVRLFVRQSSEWEIVFRREEVSVAPVPAPDEPPPPAEPPGTGTAARGRSAGP
jgi:hypothetical protein